MPLYPREDGGARELVFSRKATAPITTKIALKYGQVSSDNDIGVLIPTTTLIRKLIIQSDQIGPYDIEIWKNSQAVLVHSVTVIGTSHFDDTLLLTVFANDLLQVFITNNGTSQAKEVVVSVFIE